MLDSDLKAAELEKWSLHDKSKGERGIVRVDGVCARVHAQRERRDEGTCATATPTYP
jgi:hypothetical protein